MFQILRGLTNSKLNYHCHVFLVIISNRPKVESNPHQDLRLVLTGMPIAQDLTAARTAFMEPFTPLPSSP